MCDVAPATVLSSMQLPSATDGFSEKPVLAEVDLPEHPTLSEHQDEHFRPNQTAKFWTRHFSMKTIARLGCTDG